MLTVLQIGSGETENFQPMDVCSIGRLRHYLTGFYLSSLEYPSLEPSQHQQQPQT